MNRTTNAFIIAACSVIIGYAGIMAYNHFQNQYRQNALEKCKEDSQYRNAISFLETQARSRYPDISLRRLFEGIAKERLDKCLGEYGLAIKE